MDKITLPNIKEEKVSQNVSKFIIDPLFPGYGPTIGNALRRVLLSSIPGATITKFKIEGATHEFTSIPHIKEDIVEIMLNLKTIKVKSDSNDPVVLTLTKKGPSEVTANDFSKNNHVEIINPDQHIATLDNKAKLEMEITIEHDRGFRQTENYEKDSKNIGDIVIDAAFSPIERVKLDVENTRVGQMTNYDKLILEVSTNGGIDPKTAMVEASHILIDHYKSFSFNEEPAEILTEKLEPNENILDEPVMIGESIDSKTKIEESGLSQRTTNALINSGIKTIAGLQRLSDLKLSEIKGLGQKGIEEIKDALGNNEETE